MKFRRGRFVLAASTQSIVNISYVASSILVQLDTSGPFYLDALAKKKFILIRIALVLVVELVEGPFR